VVGRRWWGWKRAGKVVLDFQVGDGRGWRTRRGRGRGSSRGTSRATEARAWTADEERMPGHALAYSRACGLLPGRQRASKASGDVPEPKRDRTGGLSWGHLDPNRGKLAENQEEFGSAFGDLPAMEQGCVRAASSCSQTFAARSCGKLGFEPERGAARGVGQSQ
jgi:hypothetical protein